MRNFENLPNLEILDIGGLFNRYNSKVKRVAGISWFNLNDTINNDRWAWINVDFSKLEKLKTLKCDWSIISDFNKTVSFPALEHCDLKLFYQYEGMGGDKKSLKTLLEKNMYNRFSEVIDERKNKDFKYETIFIGLKSSKILEFKKIENIYKVSVNFVSEIITCVKDKNNNIIEGNPDTIKTVHDIWKFSKNMWSQDPTWYLVDTSK